MPTAERPPTPPPARNSFDPKANIEAGVAWAREHYGDALDELGQGAGYVGGKRVIRSEHGPEIKVELKDGEYVIPRSEIPKLAREVMREIERQAARGDNIPPRFRR